MEESSQKVCLSSIVPPELKGTDNKQSIVSTAISLNKKLALKATAGKTRATKYKRKLKLAVEKECVTARETGVDLYFQKRKPIRNNESVRSVQEPPSLPVVPSEKQTVDELFCLDHFGSIVQGIHLQKEILKRNLDKLAVSLIERVNTCKAKHLDELHSVQSKNIHALNETGQQQEALNEKMIAIRSIKESIASCSFSFVECEPEESDLGELKLTSLTH